MDRENRLCYVSCASCFMSFAKSFALIPRYSCHNFFKISSLIFYFSNFRGTLEADDVIGKEWELLSVLMYCWTGLLIQCFLFRCWKLWRRWWTGLKRYIEQVWNITNKWSLLTLGKYLYIAKTGDVIPNSNNVVLVKCEKEKWKKGISQITMNKAY